METDPLAWRLAGNAAGPAAVLGTTDTTPLDMIVGNVPAVTIGDQSTVDGVQFRPAGPVQAGVGPAGMYDLVLINDGTSLLLEASETISKQIGTGAGAGREVVDRLNREPSTTRVESPATVTAAAGGLNTPSKEQSFTVTVPLSKH